MCRTRRRPPVSLFLVVAVVALVFVPRVANAQDENPVYVDDSPRAWQQFRRADDHLADNVGEAVRIYQELLDDYGSRVLPVHESRPDHLVAVRSLVHTKLLTNAEALERYRLLEDAAARRLWDAGQIEQLALTRSLTESGLDALLRLAQSDLEMGRFHAARGWLDEAAVHPDLIDRRAVHWTAMRGLVAHCLNDHAVVRELIDDLEQLGADGREAAADLRERDRLRAYPTLYRATTLDDVPAVEGLDELVGEPIWTTPLEDVVAHRHLRGMELGGDRFDASMDHLLTAAPTLLQDTLFINEGYIVRALDVFTGAERWRWGVMKMDETPPDEQIMDLNIVAARGESVVTLTGHAFPTARVFNGSVVCLNRRDGSLRWSVEIDGIGGSDEHDDLFPHGSPIIADGKVFVLARKVTKQLLTSAYVVALDEATGELRWARHIASCGGVRSQNGRPLSGLVHDDGSLYVATAVGAIARLDARTGLTRWLRRYRTPVQTALGASRPWEIGRPAVTPRGLVALEPDQTRVVLLDLDTGDQIASYPAGRGDAWAAPRYLLADGSYVYAIGHEVRAFHIEALGEPQWILPDPKAPAIPGLRRSSGQGRFPRGRVQLVDGAVVLPTLYGIHIVDGETGQTLNTVPVRTACNVLASGGQLVLTTTDSAAAYMQLNRAEAMLRRRITAEPDNPDPALSLMRLGMRSRDLELALDAAVLAVESLNRLGDAPDALDVQMRLFTNLLDMVAEDLAKTDDEAEALYGMIGSVAVGPAQQIEHLLAYGDWLAGSRLADAVEAYQAILSTPALANAWHSVDDTRRPAADWAARRIARLIETHGAQVYAPQNQYAARRLDELLAIEPDSTAALTGIVEEFPFATAAVDAAVRAAEAFLATGDQRAAFGVLSSLYRRASVKDAEIRVLTRFVPFCIDAGWDAQARALLRDLVRRRGDVRLVVDGEPRQAADWSAALDDATHAAHLARVGPLDDLAREFTGTMIPLHANAISPRPRDRVHLYDPVRQVVRCLDTPDLRERWSRPVEGVDPSMLAADADTVLLWFEGDLVDPRVMALDAATGDVRWTSDPIDRHFPDPVRAIQRERGVADLMPSGTAFLPAETVPLVDANTVYLVRRSGEAIALDRADGQVVLWKRATTLERVYDLALHECALVLSGMQRLVGPAGRGEMAPQMLVIDPRRGTDVQTIMPLSAEVPRWIHVTPLGLLAAGNGSGVQVHDLLSGGVLWTNQHYAVHETLGGWIVRDDIVVEDQGESLRTISLREGLMSEPLEVPSRPDWTPIDLVRVQTYRESMVALYEKRLLSYDDSGRLFGADIIVDDRHFKWVRFGEERFVLVNRWHTDQPRDDRGRRRMRYIYRFYTLTPDCRLEGENVEMELFDKPLIDATLLDGWLLVSTAQRTLAVPAPVDDADGG